MIPTAVAVDDLLTFLGLPSDGIRTDELTAYAVAATGATEGIVGPIVERELTSRVTVSGGIAILPKRPVVSVASIGAVTGPFDIDSTAGLVRGPLSDGEHAATYRAGRAANAAQVPADIAMAVKIIAKHLYDVQRGDGRGGAFGDAIPAAPTGFAIPARAAQLLAPYRQIGVA